MADRYITDLQPATDINDTDALLVDQSNEPRMITGTLLKNYINRNILDITVQTGASTAPAEVVSYDEISGALVLKIPKGIGIKSIDYISQSGRERTYHVVYDDDSYDPIIVYNGQDGQGAVNSVDGVEVESGTTNVPLGALRLDASVGTVITSGNLNLFKAGVAQVNGGNVTNSPFSGFFLLICGGGTKGGTTVYTQLAINTIYYDIKIRRYISGRWSEWSSIANTTKTTVSMPTSAWENIELTEIYTQTVTVSGGTSNTKVDLQLDANQIQQLINDGVTALYIENNNGVFEATALGAMPSVNLTVQATLTEVLS